MRKRLVLVGGGHAHMMTLENISRFVKKNIKVTVIDPSFYHYYSGMGPGMLGGSYTPEQIRFATQKVVQKQGGIFVRDSVIKIDPEMKNVYTSSGHRFPYDVLSVNAGSFVPMDMVSGNAGNVYAVKPIEKLKKASDKLRQLFAQKKGIVGIAGGGPSSAEVAGNVWQLAEKEKKYMPEIHIFAGKRFMSRFPESVRSRIIHHLENKGINIHEKEYVTHIRNNQICLSSGDCLPVDFIFMAPGIRPSSLFESSGLPTGPDKGLLVNRFLQSVKYPDILGGGDCIHFKGYPLDKVGVYAVRENPILLHNILAALEGKKLEPFDPGPDYLIIFNLGGSMGVLKKGRIVFGGRVAFWIKHYIDTQFMKKFQALEQNS